jgi:acyl-CoA synthetase (AMP-forming)/AMP-acid ligase II
MYYWEIPETGARGGRDRLAMVCGERRLTWTEIADRSSRVAGIVQGELNLAPGSRIGVLARNGWRQLELYAGITKAGAVVVPLNWRLSQPELDAILDDARVDAAFADEAFAECLRDRTTRTIGLDTGEYEGLLERAVALAGPPAGTSDLDPAMIVYSSGTTGEPKGAIHTHRTLTESAVRLALEMRLSPDDIFYSCLPFFFAGANSTLAAPAMRGCTLVVSDFSPDAFLEAATDHGVTATIMVPTMIRQVAEHVRTSGAALAGVHRWSYAGAAMTEGQLSQALDTFGPVFLQHYGQVESGLLGTTLQTEDHVFSGRVLPRLRSAGRPTTGVSIRLIRPETGEEAAWDGLTAGEMQIRAPSVMAGYWNRPELTRETLRDGWLRTGDIAVRDPDGFIFLVDRVKDMIITGGINVFPREIEEVVLRHEAIDQVAVVGVPSDDWGEEVTACVTVNAPVDESRLAAEVEALCRGALASYKKPRRVVVLESLPLTGSGKVSKRAIREALTALSDERPESNSRS